MVHSLYVSLRANYQDRLWVKIYFYKTYKSSFCVSKWYKHNIERYLHGRSGNSAVILIRKAFLWWPSLRQLFRQTFLSRRVTCHVTLYITSRLSWGNRASQGDKRKIINDMHLCLIVKHRSIIWTNDMVEGWDYGQMFMFAALAGIPAADFRF